MQCPHNTHTLTHTDTHTLTPLLTGDATDRPFLLDQEQYVIWAIGPVGSISTPLGTTIPVPFRHYANAAQTGNVVDFPQFYLLQP